jgi:hypothetical protein
MNCNLYNCQSSSYEIFKISGIYIYSAAHLSSASRLRMIKKNAIGRFCYDQKKEGSVYSGIVPGGEEATDLLHAPFP